MRRYDAEIKAREEFGDCILRYKLQKGDDYSELHRKNYEKMKKALEAVGIWLNVEDDELRLSIYPEGYVRTKERNAGRRTRSVWKKEEMEKGNYELYKYSDIVFMMQSMKDQDIADKIGMPIATFYRHKKAMKASNYFKKLDLNRLSDKEYLDTVAGNFGF